LFIKPNDLLITICVMMVVPWSTVFGRELPATGTAESPLVLLEAEPAVPDSGEWMQVYGGAVIAHEGDDYVDPRDADVVVARKGYAYTSVTFRYTLDPPMRSGRYEFWASFQLGGTQPQEFTISAGPSDGELTPRATLQLRSPDAWKMSWLKGGTSLMLLPGDRILTVSTKGHASDAKVFDAFLLTPKALLPVAMTEASGIARRAFLAAAYETPRQTKYRLYVLDDGNPSNGDVLFEGLVTDWARAWYASVEALYIVGAEAKSMAARYGVDQLPAAILADDRNTLLGILMTPRSQTAVVDFLRTPRALGALPERVPVDQPTPRPLVASGAPRAWLVSGVWGGLAGYSTYGLDAERWLRPNPGEAYIRQVMLTDYRDRWLPVRTYSNGAGTIDSALDTSYDWMRGTAYAHLYLHANDVSPAVLHFAHTGIKTAGWLDGQPLVFEQDPAIKPATHPLARSAKFTLTRGWHRLLIKVNTAQERGARFAFDARFTDPGGEPLSGIQTQLYDPNAILILNQDAVRLHPLFYVDAPANLPHPGKPLRVRVDMRWLEKTAQGPSDQHQPIAPFKAALRLRMTDLDGRQRARREIISTFPGIVSVDLGPAPEPGFYALYASLVTPSGRFIASYPADGFSVIRGAAAQLERLEQKKAWNSYYYLHEGPRFGDSKHAYEYVLPWMNRMGIAQNMGSHWGFPEPLWEAARDRGLVLTGDFHDPHQEDGPADKARLAKAAADYTRYFKSYNEIDIDTAVRPSPERWVELTRMDYEAVKAARPDALYGGGSFARPGAPDVVHWFTQALRLGLHHYQDRWDVHAYPQLPPLLEGDITNNADEADRGIRGAFEALGLENTLTFWLGETGALPWHGANGLRWQADTVAKIIAWVNSRHDYELAAFCAAFAYTRELPWLWEYAMGHRPGEAALYTASALIDGLPYRRVQTRDGTQAAWFGETLMLWSTHGPRQWRAKLRPDEVWLTVDVVGRTRAVPLQQNGTANIQVNSSPVYVLTQKTYDLLTRFDESP
jgi:hypothetical protein